MKQNNFLIITGIITLIITTFINFSIHQKNLPVLGQTTNICQNIGGTCVDNCTASTTTKCLAGRALGCSTTYCAKSSTTPISTTVPVPTTTQTPKYVPCQEIRKIYVNYCQSDNQPTTSPKPTNITISPTITPTAKISTPTPLVYE